MKTLLENFENYLLDNLPKSKTFHPYFEDALSHMLKAGGKRFRPMLLLSVVKSNKSLLIRNNKSLNKLCYSFTFVSCACRICSSFSFNSCVMNRVAFASVCFG